MYDTKKGIDSYLLTYYIHLQINTHPYTRDVKHNCNAPLNSIDIYPVIVYISY